MQSILLCALLPLLWKCTYAGFYTNCQLEGLTSTHWMMSYRLKYPINDTYEGQVATFKSKNILGLTVESPVYLNATFENEVVTIFTTERFKNFEKEVRNSYEKMLSIKLDCECSDGKLDSITIYQSVTDVNNHDPVFNKESYEYNFAMAIPKDFDLTEFQTISASDDDFTNNKIYFTMEPKELSKTLRINREGRKKYGNNDDYFTSLIALKNITAPFKQEFTIIATDVGEPTKSTKAKVVVNVMSSGKNDSENENFVHPPVFWKYLYFANYTSSNEIKMEETITIKHGATMNMVVRQSGYTEYFKIAQNSLVKEEIKIQTIKPLPNDILRNDFILIEIEAANELSSPGRASVIIRLSNENKDITGLHPPMFSRHLYFANYTADRKLKMKENIAFKYGATNNTLVRQHGYEKYIKIHRNILNNTELQVEVLLPLNNTVLGNELVIEIEAENKGLSIPGRTALIIHLLKDSGSNSEDCNVIHIWGFSYGNSTFSLILFLTATTIIVMLNVTVLSLYFRQQRMGLRAVNQPTVIAPK